MKIFLIGKYPEKKDTEEYTKLWLKELTNRSADFIYKKLFFKEEPLKTLLRIPYYLLLFFYCRPQIIHIQYFADAVGPLFPLLLLGAKLLPKSKIILLVHEKPDFLLQALPRGWRKIYLLFEKINFSLADYLITHTAEAKQIIGQQYKLTSKKIEVVPFPWYEPRPVRASLTELKEKYQIKEQFIFTIFGRLVPKKGAELSLKPFQQLLAEGYDCGLILAGLVPTKYNAYQKEINRQIEALGLKNKVHQLGFLTAEQVSEIFKITDASLLLYRQVTQSGAFFTSLGHGVPVIAADLPGFSELMKTKKIGWLVQPENPTLVFQALKEAISQPQLLATYRENIIALKPFYSWKKIVDRYEEIYQKI